MVTAGAPPPPSSTPPQSPSRKRLLSAVKPPTKPHSPDLLHRNNNNKRTRDLPNLSYCHACGCHVNPTDPRERLRTLDSLWRVVLLCRRCHVSVSSSHSCSYCFSPAAATADCHVCPDCGRRVHVDCVSRYESSAPWSYCNNLGIGFTVCVDCWVPKLLSSKVCRRRNRTDNGGGKTRVSVEEKKLVAAKAKENALKKAVVARRAVELANGALKMVAESRGNDAELAIDDAELARRLHRAINSSPRISKRSRLDGGGENSCTGASESRGRFRYTYQRGRSLKSRFTGTMTDMCTEIKLRENKDATFICRAGDSDHELLVYKRKCKRGDEGQGKGEVFRGNSTCFENSSCDMKNEFCVDDHRRRCQLECRGSGMALCNGECSGTLDRSDRYVLKYRKRGYKDQAKGDGFRENNEIFENLTCKKYDELEMKLHVDDHGQCHFECDRNDVYADDYGRCYLKCNGNAAALPDGIRSEKLNSSDRYVLKYRKRTDEDQEKGERFYENGAHIDHQTCNKQDELQKKLYVDEHGQCHFECNRNELYVDDLEQCHSECNGNALALPTGICSEKLKSSDRYLMTYRKRSSKDHEKSDGFCENGANSENQTCNNQDELEKRLCFDDYRSRCNLECNGNVLISVNRMCSEKLDCSDRYILKYRKQGIEDQEEGEGFHENSTNFGNLTCNEEVELEKLCVDDHRSRCQLEINGNAMTLHNDVCNQKVESSERYMLKYTKRTVRSKEATSNGSMLFVSGSCDESIAKATELPQKNVEEFNML